MTTSNNSQVRALDPTSFDWTFGQSGNNFQQNQDAIAQSIRTRLLTLKGECFFSTQSGVDWLSLLGQKDLRPLNLAISSTILATTGVTGIVSLSANLDHVTRDYTVSYQVQTIYSVTAAGQFTFSLNGTMVG